MDEGTAEVSRGSWAALLRGDRWYYAIVLTGAGLAVIHLIHVYEMLYYGFIGVVLEGMVPLALAGILALSGPWLVRRGYSLEERRTVFKWMALVAVAVGLLFGWALSHQSLLGEPFPHAEFVTTTNITVGALLGIIIGTYDVHSRRDRRAIEEERETVAHQRLRLSVLNRALRHNIRNDATVILGTTQEIANDSGGEVSERAQVAASKTAELVELGEKARQIDNVLAAEDRSTEEVDIEELVMEVVERFRTADNDVSVDIPPGLAHFETKREVLAKVLEELVENASEHGGADSRVQITARQSNEEWLDLVVADNGPGLPAHEMAVLQAERETSLEHVSGLGLWLVNWGVEILGGDLEFDESEWGGTSIHMRLPVSG